MDKSKKCPNCKAEMEVGYHYGGFWISGGQPKLTKLTKIPGRKMEWVVAWKCSQCRKVEFSLKSKPRS